MKSFILKTLFWCLCLFPNVHAEEVSLPSLHICTLASHHTKGLDQLLKSCERYSIAIDVLGMGMPFRGLSEKLVQVQNYIQDLPPGDLVLFVDAYDVLFLNTADAIRDKFLAMGVTFLISAERYCFPLGYLEPQFPRGPTSFRYTNSGSYMGYVCSVQQIFDDLSPISPASDDQGLLMAHFFQFPGRQTFDVYCDIFMPCAGVIEPEVRVDPLTGVVTCAETGSNPCLLHGNGGSRPIYQKLYEYLYEEGPPLY